MPDEDAAALPRLEDLPESEHGYDRAAVAAAFAAFGRRIGELEGEVSALRPVAAEIRQELRALRSGGMPTAELAPGDVDWPVEANGSGPAEAWTASPTPPLPRPFVLPRLVLETAFLVLVAALAAVADLEPLWIAAVMAAAWVIVALAEWAAWAKRRRWHLEEIPPAVVDVGSPDWYAPPVEQTIMQAPEPSESHTVVASLPAPAGEDTGVLDAADADEATEEDAVAPRRRFGFLRRRRGESAGDPWESAAEDE